MYHPSWPAGYILASSRVAVITDRKLLIIPILGTVAISALLFEKLCRLYVRPVS